MNTFVYTKKEDGSFDIEHNATTDQKLVTQNFRLGEVTNWQIGRMNAFVGQLLKESEGIGSVIVSAILSFANNGDSKELEQVLKGFNAMSKGTGFVNGLTSGIASIFAFFGANNRMAELAAILFLAKGEVKLNEVEFKARVELFEGLPAGQTGRAVLDFFGKKIASLTNSPLFSQISETMSKKSVSPTSESSIAPSTGSSGSSTSSPKDIPSDDGTSLASPLD